MNNLPNAIMMSSNKDFFPVLKTCLQSIKDNFLSHPQIIINHTDFGRGEIKELTSLMKNRIIFVKNDITICGPIMDHLSSHIDPKVFYARLSLWSDKIYEQYDNILHLDADTLVLDDLTDLLKSTEFYCVKEVYDGQDKIFRNHNDLDLQQLLKQDGIMIGNDAWNGGVFLLPKKYRTLDNYSQLTEFINKYGPYLKRADQSLLNIWTYCHNITIQTNYTYNYQHRLLLQSNPNIPINSQRIIHFNGISDTLRLNCMKYYYESFKQGLNNKNYFDFYDSIR